jgi:hypothetical protein
MRMMFFVHTLFSSQLVIKALLVSSMFLVEIKRIRIVYSTLGAVTSMVFLPHPSFFTPHWSHHLTGGLGHGDDENRLIPTVVQKLADGYSVQSVATGGFHMAAIAVGTAEIAEKVGAEDDEEEDVYGFVLSFFLS